MYVTQNRVAIVEASIVVDPARSTGLNIAIGRHSTSDFRVSAIRDFLSHRFTSALLTPTEVDETFPPAVLDRLGERCSLKNQRRLRIVSSPVVIFAVHYSGLFGVELQFTLLDRSPDQSVGFPLLSAFDSEPRHHRRNEPTGCSGVLASSIHQM